MARNRIKGFHYLIIFVVIFSYQCCTEIVMAAPGLESGRWKICQSGLSVNGKPHGDVIMKLDSMSGTWQPAEIETLAVPPGTKIAKMSGLGNDFVILDNRTEWLKDYVCTARSLSAQLHTDGLLVIERSDKADLRMLIYDADGTWEAMCGNGIRCFVKHAYDTGICTKKELEVETGAGIKHIVVVKNADGPDGFQVRVDMGAPELQRSRIPMKGPDTPAVIDEILTVGGYPYKITAVNTGIPHTVVFSDKLPGAKLKDIAPLIENNPVFPEKTNVEFVTVDSRRHVNAQVWEVGVGETRACGTGACAMVVAGNLKGILDNEVTVTYPGGDLAIKWEGKGHSVIMTGPAVELFHGVAVKGTLGQKEEGEMTLTLAGSKLTGKARLAAGPGIADYTVDGTLSGTAVELRLSGKDGSHFIYKGTVSCDGKGMGGMCSPGSSTGKAVRAWNAEFLPTGGGKPSGLSTGK